MLKTATRHGVICGLYKMSDGEYCPIVWCADFHAVVQSAPEWFGIAESDTEGNKRPVMIERNGLWIHLHNILIYNPKELLSEEDEMRSKSLIDLHDVDGIFYTGDLTYLINGYNVFVCENDKLTTPRMQIMGALQFIL